MPRALYTFSAANGQISGQSTVAVIDARRNFLSFYTWSCALYTFSAANGQISGQSTVTVIDARQSFLSFYLDATSLRNTQI